MNSSTTSMTITQLSPQIIVSDLERSIEFYTIKLGFQVDFRYEDFYVGIIKDGFSIHLKSGDPLVNERNHKRDNEDLDIVISITDIEDFYNECLKQQIDITHPLTKRPYGKEFYIADPDGYIFSFVEVP